MTLGRITKEVADAVRDGRFVLEDGEEDFGWTGIECEVRGCRERSEEFLDLSEDVGHNLCKVHYGIIFGFIYNPLGEISVRVRWDDGTRSNFGWSDASSGEASWI